MGRVYTSVDQLIGGTPILRLVKTEKELSLKAKLFVKLEYFNPCGSAKDRVAKSIIERAEREGKLKEGGIIIEPTSGNTGIALAAIGRARGYRVIIVMPDTMSAERRKLIKAYGAELVLSNGAEGMSGAIKKAEQLASKYDGAIIAGQFDNPANPDAHYKTTAREIWEDTDGAIDIFVAGVGTGGTLSGAGRFLKEKNKDVRIVAVEPADSPVLSQGRAGAHAIQGIGAGFVPKTLDTDIYDEVIAVSGKDAFECARSLAKREGALVGISSGAALSAAIELAKKEENKGKNVLAMLPDTGERYLSTALFED